MVAYRDEYNATTGVVTRNVGVKVLDGTEGFVYESQYSRFSTDLMPNSIVQSSVRSIPAYCSHFEMLSNSESLWNITPGQGYVIRATAQSSSGIYFHSHITTVAGFKQWLADQYNAGTPVTVVYPLATPTTESVTGQSLQVQQGDNIVEITQASLDNLELEVKYKKQA